MVNVNSNKKQKVLLATTYDAGAPSTQRAKRLPSNIYNLLDDDNDVDKELIRKTRRYMFAHRKHTAQI